MTKSDYVIHLCQRHVLTLPEASAHLYRPGSDAPGSIASLNLYSVRVLVTDGLLAWFLLGDGQTTFEGHLENWEEQSESEGEKPSATRERKLPKKLLAAIAED